MGEAKEKPQVSETRFPHAPARIRALPVDARGFPVPKFVSWIDGVPDFRVVAPEYLALCVRRRLCWICGEPLGRYQVFVLGPMCALSMVASEPPCHRDCAGFAATACPFLSNPNAKRPARPLPEGHVPPPGNFITRNPGVVCLWTTESYQLTPDRLFAVGPPVLISWYAEGRRATRQEIEESVRSGMPLLVAEAKANGNQAERLLSQRAEWFNQQMREYTE